MKHVNADICNLALIIQNQQKVIKEVFRMRALKKIDIATIVFVLAAAGAVYLLNWDKEVIKAFITGVQSFVSKIIVNTEKIMVTYPFELCGIMPERTIIVYICSSLMGCCFLLSF